MRPLLPRRPSFPHRYRQACHGDGSPHHLIFIIQDDWDELFIHHPKVFMDKHTALLAAEFGQKQNHVENVINLLDEGNTVPFIARYRKEATGAMDDEMLRA